MSLKKILESEAGKIFHEYKSEILDILLFGSLLKGKAMPNDIDIIIIFKEKKDLQIAYNLRKSIEKITNMNVDVISKSYQEIFSPTFQAREAILSESYSLINKAGFSESLGYKNVVMFIYNLKGKNKSERMRFYYSLNGRNSEGMLKILKATKYADTVIVCPIDEKDNMKSYLENWKIEFREISLLMPVRLL